MVLKKEITHQIKEILKENPQGLSITDIVKAVNINRNTAGRYLENLLVSGQVEMRRFGMAKIYQLSQRVPLSAVLSLSSELVLQLDSGLRIVFANEPFLSLVGTDSKNLLGKNIEYTPVALVFDESFPAFIEDLRNGITGKEWAGEIELTIKDIILFCQIAPTVFEDGRKGVSVILEDITQRKLAEQKVEESELQFRLLAENSLDMICRIKPDYTLIYVSPVYKVAFGYLPEEVIGSNVEVFIHPEEAHILESLRIDLTPQKSSAIIKFRLKHKDGHYIWTETTVRAIFDENTQELSEYYTVTRDITERRRAEEALRDSEKRHRTIFENTGTATVQIEENTIISLANAEFEHLSGFSRHEIEGKKSWTEFVVKEDLEWMLDQHRIRMVGQERSLKNYEFRFISKSGDLRNIFLTIELIPGTKKSVASLLDITERKIAENSLRESEERYRQLVNISPDAVMIHREGKIIFMNPAALKLLGILHAEEVVGKNVFDFIHPEYRDSVRKNIEKDLEGEVTPSLELYMSRLDGSPIIVEGKGVKTVIDGKPAVQVAIKDITERKHAETALRESEEISRALINAPTDSVILMDSRGIILALNETAALRFGKKSNELVGVLADDLLPEELAQSRRSLISQGTGK